MAAAEDGQDSYVFNRDYLSSIRSGIVLADSFLVYQLTMKYRLNYMHFWSRKLCGYLLHPLIPIKGTDLRVADVGTGTG